MTDQEIIGEIEGLVNSSVQFTTEDVATREEGPILLGMDDVEVEDVQWLWPDRIPAGCLSTITGRPGEGKSYLTSSMAAHVSTGRNWPDGSACPMGSVLIVNVEDDPARTIKPRLVAHGADVSKITMLTGVTTIDDDGNPQEGSFTLGNIEALERAVQSREDVQLIIIDPIGSFLGSRIDSHRDNEVRSILAPLAKLAAKYNLAVLIICHTRKTSGNFADDATLGSRAFVGLARATWHLDRDPDDTDRRRFLPGKNNLAKESHGLAFRIEGDPPAVQWEDGLVELTADEALAERNSAEQGRGRPGPDPVRRDEAVSWLRELLASGPKPVSEVRSDADAAGLVWRTVQRAATGCGILRERNGNEGRIWRLPPVPEEST